MKPESGHWYTPQGEPAHWQQKKDGSGTTPTRIDHARKFGLYRGVTNIIGIIDKPALREWLIRQSVLAVVTAPDVPGEGIDAKITRVLDTEQQQDQEAQQARDRGSDMHAALESLLKGQPVSDGILPWVQPAYTHISGLISNPKTEQILVGPGYAGRADLYGDTPEGVLLVDFKTTGKLPTKGSWPEHILQLSAYAFALRHQKLVLPGTNIRTANLYISTKEQGAFVFHLNPPWEETYHKGFAPLFQFWQFFNNYYPCEINPPTHEIIPSVSPAATCTPASAAL